VIADLRQHLAGVVAMLSFKEDWRAHFDVSERGLWRSFLAAVWGVPFFALVLIIQSKLVLALAEDPAQARTAGLGYAGTLYAVMWLYFPLVARLFTGAFGLRGSLAPWIVVHNWTLLFLLMVHTVIGLPLLAGLVSAEAHYSTTSFYFLLVVFAHCRAAIGALDAPWSLAIGGACLALILWLMAQLGLAYMLSGSAVQA